MRPPQETANEWIRFLDTKPTGEDVVTWLTLKAVEVGWSYEDLSGCLIGQVRNPMAGN